MNGRLLASFALATALIFAGTESLGALISPPQLKVIATVVSRPHAEVSHWYGQPYTHGL